MLLIPVPVVVALVLGFLLVRAVLRGEGHPLLRALIGACAAQSVIVALVQHYGIAWLRPVQPVTATLLPPLAWLAFVAVSLRPLSPERDGAHGLAPLAAIVALFLAPAALDPVIVCGFAGYGLALLRATIGEGAVLPRARLEGGDVPRRVWLAVGVALLGSAVVDAAIAVDQALAAGAWRGPLVSLAASAILLAVGALALSRDLDPPGPASESEGETTAPDPEEAAREADLIARLERLLTDERLHLDPDLTLSRLARRLGVPAKPLSAAINRACGESVSRVVNRRRVAHAAALLESGATVTRAMLESGFNTKSNFNREFSRLKGASPTAWLAARRAAAETTPAQ